MKKLPKGKQHLKSDLFNVLIVCPWQRWDYMESKKMLLLLRLLSWKKKTFKKIEWDVCWSFLLLRFFIMEKTQWENLMLVSSRVSEKASSMSQNVLGFFLDTKERHVWCVFCWSILLLRFSYWGTFTSSINKYQDICVYLHKNSSKVVRYSELWKSNIWDSLWVAMKIALSHRFSVLVYLW